MSSCILLIIITTNWDNTVFQFLTFISDPPPFFFLPYLEPCSRSEIFRQFFWGLTASCKESYLEPFRFHTAKFHANFPSSLEVGGSLAHTCAANKIAELFLLGYLTLSTMKTNRENTV